MSYDSIVFSNNFGRIGIVQAEWFDIPGIVIIQVDCTVEKATCDKFGVKGFPTLKIFRNGLEAQSYEGPRDADGIVKYMRGQAGPSAKELKSVEEFKKFVSGDENAVVGMFLCHTFNCNCSRHNLLFIFVP